MRTLTPQPTAPESPDPTLKDVENGNCNVTACQRPGATWQHRTNHLFYCPACARKINEANYHDAMRLYGAELIAPPPSK